MRRFLSYLVAVLGLVVAVPAYPQGAENRVEAVLVDEFDVTTAGYTYFAFGERNQSTSTLPLLGALELGTFVNIPVITVGSSTTVSALTASTAPFANVQVGDLIIFPRVKPGTSLATSGFHEAVVTARASADSITISAAVDLSSPTTGSKFYFKTKYTDTAQSSVFFDVSKFVMFNIQADVETINATSLDFTLECRLRKFDQRANTVYTKNFTAVGADAIAVSVPYEQCRVGWKVTGDAGAQDVAVHFTGVLR